MVWNPGSVFSLIFYSGSESKTQVPARVDSITPDPRPFLSYTVCCYQSIADDLLPAVTTQQFLIL